MSPPAMLFIQGKLKSGAEGVYQKYLAGTGPLMAEYGARVTAVGAAVESELTTDAWPINAILSFRDRDTFACIPSPPTPPPAPPPTSPRWSSTSSANAASPSPPRTATSSRWSSESKQLDFRAFL